MLQYFLSNIKKENNMTKPEKRRKQILSILADVPISSTQQLAETIGVSNETIRKDLDFLSKEGKILKVHGGVSLTTGNINEIPFDLRAAKNASQKKAIAHQAVSLIQKEDTILLESCTTNLELAKALLLLPEILETLTIVTNSFAIMSLLEGGQRCKHIFFLGGWVNPSQHSTIGHKTAMLLKDFHVSKAFLSGAALSTQFILTGYYQDDVEFQQTALSAAQEIILMIDSSKFGQTAVFSVTQLSNFDYLITDKVLSSSEIAYLTSANVKYLMTDPVNTITGN
jgi:DeoR/GlpR family transcriptional regulator of sugar metabolism